MKTQFETLKANSENLTKNQLIDSISDLTAEIIKTDSRLLSVDKSWSGYGTWKSVGFANEYHFGYELAKILTKALTGTITHNEEKEFELPDFSDEISDAIYDAIY